MTEKIKYHPGFVGGLGLLLWEYRDLIDIEPEKWLSTEGIRMDVLILKKDPAVTINNDMCRLFKGYNILEYKRPDDELSIDVFSKVMAYAWLYKSLGATVDAVPFRELTATIFRHRFPRRLFKKLEEQGIQSEKMGAGIYYVHGAAPFAVQVVVGKELNPKEYAMFRVLTPGALKVDLDSFHEMAFRTKDAAYRRYADSIFQVSVSANKPLYIQMTREDKEMCEALRDLLKEDFEAAEIKGETKGSIRTAISLYRDEMGLDAEEITVRLMQRFSLSREEAEKHVKENLSLQPA